MGEKFRAWRKCARTFLRANGGNVAMMFGLSLIPLSLAAGAGLDLARAVMVRSSMADALDAAALAVGATPGISQSDAQSLAQQYFDANYTQNTAEDGTPAAPTVSIVGQSVTLSVTNHVPTTLLSAVHINSMPVTVSSTVVWGQSKLWVALVLDNTGSMTQTDSTGTSKISALQTASHQLLSTLKNASTNVGDVQVTITPFSKDVNVGTGVVNQSWIDWTDWSAPPPNVSTSGWNAIGPGSACPFTDSRNRQMSPYGYYCTSSSTNGASTASTIPSSGVICPGVDSGNYNTGYGGHYYNGCYNSVASTQTVTCVTPNRGSQTCTTTVSSGGYSGSTKQSCTTKNKTETCVTKSQIYAHTWQATGHTASTWHGCIMDRAKDFDTDNSQPSSSKGNLFPAENSQNCPSGTVTALPATWTTSQWTALNNQIDNMVANGSTNQTIGLVHGWQTLTSGAPYSAPTLPANTSQYIILLSDGLNTQDRWYGDGSNQSTDVDARMADACSNAKAAGFTIYTVFVDLNGTQGNSSVLQNCATDTSKYFDLTTSGAIVTAFNQIAQQISDLRISK